MLDARSKITTVRPYSQTALSTQHTIHAPLSTRTSCAILAVHRTNVPGNSRALGLILPDSGGEKTLDYQTLDHQTQHLPQHLHDTKLEHKKVTTPGSCQAAKNTISCALPVLHPRTFVGYATRLHAGQGKTPCALGTRNHLSKKWFQFC